MLLVTGAAQRFDRVNAPQRPPHESWVDHARPERGRTPWAGGNGSAQVKRKEYGLAVLALAAWALAARPAAAQGFVSQTRYAYDGFGNLQGALVMIRTDHSAWWFAVPAIVLNQPVAVQVALLDQRLRFGNDAGIVANVLQNMQQARRQQDVLNRHLRQHQDMLVRQQHQDMINQAMRQHQEIQNQINRQMELNRQLQQQQDIMNRLQQITRPINQPPNIHQPIHIPQAPIIPPPITIPQVHGPPISIPRAPIPQPPITIPR
jgi:hypothetical protein